MKLHKELVTTADGSSTFYMPEINEYYHSHHGAVQEAKHVFLAAGLHQFPLEQELTILEIGFGTGLNAWLTACESLNRSGKIKYLGLEAFPLSDDETTALNYTDNTVKQEEKALFELIHQAEWNTATEISSCFCLEKLHSTLEALELADKSIDLVYFDAFGPRVQPEMWSLEVFQRIAKWMKPKGLLVTYCAKGQVKRDLRSAGFSVETLVGPPGKREMVRGIMMEL